MSQGHPTSEQLNAYVLDELDGVRRGEVEAHLDRCASCREAATLLEAALAAYRDVGSEPVDEQALTRLLVAQPDHAPHGGSSRWSVMNLAVAATVAALIFLGGFWTGRQGSVPPESDPMLATPAVTVVRRSADERAPAVTFAVAVVDRLGNGRLRPR